MPDQAGQRPETTPNEPWQRVLETAALLLLLSLAVLRPLILETYDSATSSFDDALRELQGPTPIRTLGFDLLVLTAACLWLLGRGVGVVRRFRWTGIEMGVVLIALASIVSSLAAGQKRLAFNASFDWLCAPLAAIVLVQLLRAPWQRRLLLGAVLATACVQTLQCYEQYSSFDSTWNEYQGMKEKFWRDQGVELNSSRVDLFEQRMKAREAGGFFAHSNIAASYLSLCGFTGLGVAIRRMLARTSTADVLLAVPAAMACLAMAGAIYLTGSRGAMLSSAIGLCLWAGVTIFDPLIRRHRTTVLLLGWACVGSAILAVVIYGLSRHSLPGASLTFRWQYWTASAHMISDHPWAGVGRENLGRHYTQYKPIEAPEEISNPHNFLVQAAAEWGIFGLVGIAAILFGGSIMATRVSERRYAIVDEPGEGPRQNTLIAFLLGAFVLGLAATVVRMPLTGVQNEDLTYYMTVTGALAWAAGFFAFGVRLSDPLVRSDAEGRTSAAVKGASIGLLVFLLHDFINFAAFSPAACYTAFTLFAFISSARYELEEKPMRRVGGFHRWGPFVIGSSAAVLLLVFFVPALRSNRALVKARSSAPEFASQFLERACAADPLDPTAFAEKARLFASMASTSANPRPAQTTAVSAVHEAVRRDRFAVSLRRMQRRILERFAALTRQESDWKAAIDAGNEAVKLYPTSPQDWIELADTQLEAAEALSSQKWALEAIDNYNRALGLDSLRPDWEWLRRLRPHEIADVEQKIHRAKVLLDQIAGAQSAADHGSSTWLFDSGGDGLIPPPA